MVTILRAQAEDIPGMKELLAATWRDTYGSLFSEAALAKIGAEWHAPKVLEAEIGRTTVFAGVARAASSDIVGMITAHSQGETLAIARLYVLPAWQRRGIGGRLLHESLRAFPQARVIRLAVEELNPKGRAFYRKAGFLEVGTRTDEVAGVTLRSVLMEKRVAGAV